MMTSRAVDCPAITKGPATSSTAPPVPPHKWSVPLVSFPLHAGDISQGEGRKRQKAVFQYFLYFPFGNECVNFC